MATPQLETAIADGRLLYQDIACASFLHDKPRTDGHAIVMIKQPGTHETLDKMVIWHLTRVIACTSKALIEVLPNVQRTAIMELPGEYVSYELYALPKVSGWVYTLPYKKDLQVIAPEERLKIVSKLEQYIDKTIHSPWDKPDQPAENSLKEFLNNLPKRFSS